MTNYTNKLYISNELFLNINLTYMTLLQNLNCSLLYIFKPKELWRLYISQI